MKFRSILIAAVTIGSALAVEGPVPTGVPRLDHVFVIMMENHGYTQVVNNPNMPFINEMSTLANTATNYFAIAHPSLTNYLELVGGSNFGVQSDNNPDWHNYTCVTNLMSAKVNTDVPASPAICPIWGMGTDAATPAIDTTNETTGPPGENNIDGIQSIPAATNITGITIADQLAAAGKTWKSYQESLGPQGADGVNFSDGFFTDSTNFANIKPVLTPPLTSSDLVYLYAAKHDPFVYFRSIQEADVPGSDMHNIVGFDGGNGLFADLATGNVPNFSFIAPNQCNDQHGRGNAGPFCNYDPNDNGTQEGLNPALLQQGDVTVHKIVTAIKTSPIWKQGQNAIVVLWDENDYSIAPSINQVLVMVDTNYGSHGTQSNTSYNHFSLLRTLEGGFVLPCLNHACNASVNAMTDLFGQSYPVTPTGPGLASRPRR